METVIQFICDYWREIASCCALIITVLLYVFRKRPSFNGVDKIKEDVLEILPVLINQVEENGNGQRKKYAVVELVKLYVKKHYKIDIPVYLLDWLENSIESILSTPQKKGDIDG